MVSPEDQIGILLLGVGHAVVQRLKRGSEFFDAVRMGVGDLAIGLEIVDGAHAVGMTGSSLSERVHRARIVAHDLRDLVPKFFLRRGDLKPVVKVIDARIDLVVGRNGLRACRCLSLHGGGSARRIGECRYREKNRYRERRCSSRSGWRGNESHDRSPKEFDGLTKGLPSLRASSIEWIICAPTPDRRLSGAGRLRAGVALPNRRRSARPDAKTGACAANATATCPCHRMPVTAATPLGFGSEPNALAVPVETMHALTISRTEVA